MTINKLETAHLEILFFTKAVNKILKRKYTNNPKRTSFPFQNMAVN